MNHFVYEFTLKTLSRMFYGTGIGQEYISDYMLAASIPRLIKRKRKATTRH